MRTTQPLQTVLWCLIKDGVQLHYGNCRTQCFCRLIHTRLLLLWFWFFFLKFVSSESLNFMTVPHINAEVPIKWCEIAAHTKQQCEMTSHARLWLCWNLCWTLKINYQSITAVKGKLHISTTVKLDLDIYWNIRKHENKNKKLISAL